MFVTMTIMISLSQSLFINFALLLWREGRASREWRAARQRAQTEVSLDWLSRCCAVSATFAGISAQKTRQNLFQNDYRYKNKKYTIN